ncbi:uncharacterized protein DUF742 [Streptomyces sp. 2132.2]|uniref:DUF742 domain-containing protein n=1 Tax=Streptomyces sp. 2132.2 TaxID=2485161 RepID=UPI000F485462|nr:DUF742 domain-containing protein [Streptomyces sp. 2132.2]ROR00085.1 uncharacterized protein DUF742 [Streptomyces sp. 2132.2]
MPEPEEGSGAETPGPVRPEASEPDAPQRGGGRRTRLYALTDGRTAAPHTVLTMDTTITAAVGAEAQSGLPTEWQAVLSMCARPGGLAVAEVAARMRIRLTPMTLLLGELADRGLIHHRPPLQGAETTNVHMLMRIRDNLARI